MGPRGEVMSLYRSFMRLRYRFPSKQGRSVLKRSTSLFFTLRQVEYDAIEEERGTREAQQQSAKWREEAHDDFQLWNNIAKLDEITRRRILDRMIATDKH